MPTDTYLAVGKLGKPFGVEGELRCKVDATFREDFLSTEVVFIEVMGRKTPFFVDTIYEGDGLSIMLEEVDTKEAAHQLSGKTIWMRPQEIQRADLAQAKPPVPFESLIGYEVHDRTHGLLGAVKDFVEVPQQVLLVVPYRGKDAYIPFQEALILEVDEDKRVLKMDLPEGLLEL